MQKLRIGLIFGGNSGEHEISLQSAQSIYEAFDKNKYQISLIRINKKGDWLLQKKPDFNVEISSDDFIQTNPFILNNDIDVYFPIVHGTYGEDGSLQGLFELLDSAYVGAFVLGSAVGMDKDIMKRLLRDAHIKTSKFYSLKKKNLNSKTLETIVKDLSFPIFVKPSNMGSSVGVSKAIDTISLNNSIENAFRFDTKIILEEAINGREIECSILGNDNPIASICGEIVPHDEFYSYKAKYIDENGAEIIIPAKLSKEIIENIQELAIKTYNTLECSGMARVDFFVTDKNEIYVNEINTLPGFTKISMYPKLWEASGISFINLLDTLIDLAVEKKKEKDVLIRDFKK